MTTTKKEVMEHNVLDFKTVCECNRCLGSKTLHPQASLINLEKPGLKEDSVKFEFYAILLIEDCVDNCNCCGRRYYDFSNATMVFLTPGEIFRMNKDHTLPEKGLLLAFHPDLLFRTELKRHINDYTFFSYRKEEALHLSQREKTTAMKCLNAIDEELQHAIDRHTCILVSRLIELLLDYCSRFYERQFITRVEKNKTILRTMETMLDTYIAENRLAGGQLPTKETFAGELNLSPAYFEDLLKFETGKTFAEHVQLKRMAAAKRLLLTPENTPTVVARKLGFANVCQFSLLFKKLTGTAPGEYRYTQN